MSFHSRSSSEVENISFSDIILVFFKDFRDFDFNDVINEVRPVFTPTQFDCIAKQKGDAQIFQLIWVLNNMPDVKILKFFDIIYNDYKWIVDKIKAEVNDPSENTSVFLKHLKALQSEFIKHTKYNVHRTRKFLELRSKLRSLNPKIGPCSVVLLGGLGSGKKWLSLDVCSDYSVMKSMNFKIYWIDCYNCTSQLEDYKALKVLMIKINPQHQFDDTYSTENFLRLKEQIKLQMKTKDGRNDCLLVLANVQNIKCQEAFNLGCKRLIITRNKKVSDSLPPKLNEHIKLDQGFTLMEFYLLLDKYLQYDWRKDSIGMANDIYHLSHGDPYLLSIIARNIGEKKSNWNEWTNNINKLQIPDAKFQRDIEKSLEIMNQRELELYATFAVFPYCAQIPVALLAHLWNKKPYEAEDIVNKFDANSFVQKQILEDNDTIVCTVTQVVYSSYIKNCNKMQQLINIQELHRKIIEYYKVEECLRERKDVDLDFNTHDGYVLRWIGYHLFGGNYKRLLSKLYKDFGFLGQKMRAVGLNNTIADLRNYDSEISLGERKYSFKKMKAFLAKMEEKIMHFPDCCLLQYALLSDDFICENALQQIEQFPRRLWFSERGQYQQWRFICSLPQSARLVRILDEDLCLVVLTNNNTLLVDLSLDSRCSYLLLMCGVNITDIHIFDNKTHVLTLDLYGSLKLWDISLEKRRLINQRQHAVGNVNANIVSCTANLLCPKQNINELINSWARIQTFYFDVPSIGMPGTLLVALKGGLLKFFDWDPNTKEFKLNSYKISHQTYIDKIHSISQIKTHYMIIYYTENGNMDATFLKLRNTEQEMKKFPWPKNAKLVYHKVCDNVVLLVFNHMVVRLSLTLQPFDGDLEILYDSPENVINCGKLLLDNKYLMLGTTRGLIIFDIVNGNETLQSSVSENIISLDNYDLDDEEFKSMIVCGSSNKNIAYIYGLRLAHDQTLAWEHSLFRQSEELAHLEQLKNTRFVGQKLFDVCEEDDTLYAVDSKNRIHQICRAETKNWSIIPSLDVQQNVIGIHCFKNSVIVSYENGDIYNLQEKRLIIRANEIIDKEFILKTVDNSLLVTSSALEMTYVKHIKENENENKITTFRFLTKYCYMIMGKYFLIVNNFGASLFFDCENNFSYTFGIPAYSLLTACDLKDNVLFLGFSSYEVHIYSLDTDAGGSIRCHKRAEIPPLKDVQITCLTASDNAKLLAIGLDTTTSNGFRSCGDIELFKLNDDYKPQLIFCLKSHVRPINDLKFSPQNEVLVSVAEQICFWNINYVLNNPLDVGSKKRHSSRFTSQKSAEEVDFKGAVEGQQQRRDRFLNIQQKFLASLDSSTHKLGHSSNISHTNSMEQSVCSDDLNDDSVFSNSIDKIDEGSWSYLMGPSDKPELLSCLKLDGNEAKQIFVNKNFTQFFTIDNEGVYYNLQRIKPSNPVPTEEEVDMTDSTSSSINLDYLDVHRLSVASSTMSGTDVVDTANNT
ncbi:Apoptotic protease-activating factor 1 [Lucilia cuprina]|nr:Apoptotic protease-activating factor 1 [Lucilia cuprina]